MPSYEELVAKDARMTIEWFHDDTADNYASRQRLLDYIGEFTYEFSFDIELGRAIAASSDNTLKAAYKAFNTFIEPQGHSGYSFGCMMRLIRKSVEKRPQ